MPGKEIIDLSDVKSALRPPERIIALQAERDAIATAYKEYKREHGQLEQLMAEVLASVPQIKPLAKFYKPSKIVDTETTYAEVVHVTDSHYGAVQEADEVEGFGEYNPGISRARQMGLIQDVLDWTEIHRKGYRIENCHILCTGDMVSGDIHDELRVTNAFPAPRQAVESAGILAEQVAMLSPHFTNVAVDIITLDNHGRLTRRPQSKQGGMNNWMYVVAHMAKTLLKGHENVVVNIHAMPQKVVVVNNRHYLLCHGHEVQGWMGFPFYGVERKVAKEAMKRMNAPDFTKFNKVIMGHWHAPMETQYFWVGGSVSGTDAYDHQAGRHAGPQQLSWLVHPRWGEFDRTCWDLTKHDIKIEKDS
jgi:hypothetical protein